MNQSPQTARRIVSKGEYVKVQRKRAGMFLFGTAQVLVAVSAFYGLSSLAHSLGFSSAKYLSQWFALLVVVPFIVVGLLAGIVFLAAVAKRGVTLFQQAKALDPGVPLTRANATDLPAPESLVRASDEPMQEHEAVLLRAAIQTQERHEEQLVRAAGGPE